MSLSSICYWKNEIQHLVWLKIFYFIDLRCFIIFDPIISVIYNSKPSIFIIHEARWLEHCVINITSRHPVSQILKHSPLHFTNRLWCLTFSGKKFYTTYFPACYGLHTLILRCFQMFYPIIMFLKYISAKSGLYVAWTTLSKPSKSSSSTVESALWAGALSWWSRKSSLTLPGRFSVLRSPSHAVLPV